MSTRGVRPRVHDYPGREAIWTRAKRHYWTQMLCLALFWVLYTSLHPLFGVVGGDGARASRGLVAGAVVGILLLVLIAGAYWWAYQQGVKGGPEIASGLPPEQRSALRADIRSARPSSDRLLANVERETAHRSIVGGPVVLSLLALAAAVIAFFGIAGADNPWLVAITVATLVALLLAVAHTVRGMRRARAFLLVAGPDYV